MKGKSRWYIAFAPKTTLIALFVFFPYVAFVSPNSVHPFMFLSALIIVVWQMVFFRIRVTPKGVKYRKRFFKWEDIKAIGIAVTKHGMPHKFYYKMIYISKHEHEKPVHLYHYRSASNNDEYKKVQRISVGEDIPKYLIIANFNRRLIRHLMAYWGSDIKNIDDVIGWKGYIRFLNVFSSAK